MDKSFVTIEYMNADGRKICIEVSIAVKELLEQSDRQIRSQRRQDRRHLDFAPLTDGRLGSSLVDAYEDAADLLIKKECYTWLDNAIRSLTEVQQRRLRLYYFSGLSYSQIAEAEGVNYRSVIDSVQQAVKHLKQLYDE